MLGSDVEGVGRGSNFRADFMDGLADAHRKAREILDGVQRRQNKYYDLRKRTTIHKVRNVVLVEKSQVLNHVWKCM